MLASVRGSRMNFGLAISDDALFSVFWPKFNMSCVLGSPCHINFVKKHGILSGFDDQFFGDINF